MFAEQLRKISDEENARVAIRKAVNAVKAMATDVAKKGGYGFVYPFDLPVKAIELLHEEEGLTTVINDGKVTFSW